MRAQAAVEFLTTYGWAFLLLFAVVAALLYFHVIDLRGLGAAHCVLETGLYCEDYRLGTDSLTLVLYDGFGAGLTDVNVTVATDDGACNASASVPLIGRSAASAPLVFCEGTPLSAQVKGRLIVDYRFEGETIFHHVEGSFALRRE